MTCSKCTAHFEAPHGFRVASAATFRTDKPERNNGLFCPACTLLLLLENGKNESLELLVAIRQRPPGGSQVDVLGLILELILYTRV